MPWFNVSVTAPAWLLLWLLPVVLLSIRWWMAQRATHHLCQPELQPWMLLARWQWKGLPWRWLALWSLMVLALSQPMWLSKQAQAQHQPMRWLVVVDVSTSMSATDVAPNRLQQVRWALESAASQWQQGDQAGLFVFSGSHHWLVPMTSDKSLWLSGVSLLAPDMLPLQGSLLLPALASLGQALQQPTAVAVFTDGADMKKTDFSDVKLPAEVGLVVGVGTTSGDWALAETPLRQLANRMGWDYQSLTSDNSRIWLDWLAQWRSQQPVDAKAVLSGIDLSPWLIGLALLLWLSFARWPGARTSMTASMLLVGVACMLIGGVQAPAWAADKLSVDNPLSQAQQALTEKRYTQATDQALQAFKQAYEPMEQSKALAVLAEVMIAQQHWFDAGQTLRGALAHQPNQAEVEARLAYVIRNLPKPPDRSQTPDKAGDRFEGSISDWDEAQLAWETKDVLKLATTQSTQAKEVNTKANRIMQTASSLAVAQQARQDWVLAGEMRQLQQEKRLFYQRLFSLESGFAVVQDKPQPIEGVDPW
jgi:Ca-activated chloride channel family protein